MASSGGVSTIWHSAGREPAVPEGWQALARCGRALENLLQEERSSTLVGQLGSFLR